MSDQILQTGWRLSLLTTIFVAALLGLCAAYLGVFALITGQIDLVIPRVAVACLLGGAVTWLAVHLDELATA